MIQPDRRPTRRRAAGPLAALALIGAAMVPATAGAASAASSDPPAWVPIPGPGAAPAGDQPQAGHPSIAAPGPRVGATVARIVVPSRARLRLRAGGPPGPVLRTTTAWSRQPQTLLVLAGARHAGRDWVRVTLPTRPTGGAGWIPRDHVVLARTAWWIDVRLGDRTLVVRRAGRVLRRFRVVVGAPVTPTPTGLFSLWERNRQGTPEAFVGSWVLSLTALSPVLEDFGGGPGRIGLHGRGGASLADPLGSARSHGCIRLSNAAIGWLAGRLPAGAPVRIRR